MVDGFEATGARDTGLPDMPKEASLGSCNDTVNEASPDTVNEASPDTVNEALQPVMRPYSP